MNGIVMDKKLMKNYLTRLCLSHMDHPNKQLSWGNLFTTIQAKAFLGFEMFHEAMP